MAEHSFKTHPHALSALLKECESGALQLPDFQRSWVWDEERIRSLIASVSRGFPIGALMTLETGGETSFKPRMVEGAPTAVKEPKYLLLDGQQRMTSLYQVILRKQVVKTITPKRKSVSVWFYIDIQKALDDSVDREEAIVSVPADKVIRTNFGRDIVLDLSTREAEMEHLMYPVSEVFDFPDWQTSFMNQMMAEGVRAEEPQRRWKLLNDFQRAVLENFTAYDVPVITLDKATSKEAVCTVFEKVNTGGKPLDTFELLTAIYAADGYELRKDWYGEGGEQGRQQRLTHALHLAGRNTGILAEVRSTDFLHVVSLFHTLERRRAALNEGRSGKELPQVSGNRKALLNLPLDAYRRYGLVVEEGFVAAAKFLHRLHIYRPYDLPYQSQVGPLAAVLAALGDAAHHGANRRKLEQWYWCGVFGELYGSTTETRVAKDFVEVPAWLAGGPEPSTVQDCAFRQSRLYSMRSRVSAAYKGLNALLMKHGAEDFRTGQKFEHTLFFEESVDIHHVFPQKWSADAGIAREDYDCIVNKTPLSGRTNRIIGGVAPSHYLARLERGDVNRGEPPIDHGTLDRYLSSHLIDPRALRSDDFGAFLNARAEALTLLIEEATGKPIQREGPAADKEAEDTGDSDIPV